MIDLQSRFVAAQDLARQAAELAMRMRPAANDPGIKLKGAQDWVTAADMAVEKMLASSLAAAFPEDGFLGEETGHTGQGALRWVVDPIDGTSNYARGGLRWCVSVGLMRGAEPLLGVIAAPALQETFAACLGQGATLNGIPIRAANTAALDKAFVECGWSPRRPTPDYIALCDRVMAAGAAMRAGGSGALGLADVACGRLDAYVELHINLWDVAAGLAILSEAGACRTDFPPEGGAIRAAAPGIDTALSAVVGW